LTTGTTWTLEAAEAELNRFIDRRAEKNTEQRPEEVAYAASVKRHNTRQRKETRAAWFAHFCRMSENHAKISEDYQRRAEQLCEEG
jgi:hypothetical protein